MNNYIITYNDAKEIAEYYRNEKFYETLFNYNGYKISVFNYFLCDWNNFTNPIKDKSIHALDMRGLTFVFNKDGSLFRKYLMLPKFFNLNQVEATQYDNIKDKEILEINIKEDGSLIAFIELPDGEIIAKTQGSIDNDQTKGALNILNTDPKLKSYVKQCLFNGEYTPLFEYVAFNNRIVLQYNAPELRFIGLRSNISGKFISANRLNPPKCINSIKSFNSTLDNLITLSKELENVEGWVVHFTDGQLIKVKTEWYFKMHALRTDNIFREDYIIDHYMNSTLDDIICQLDPIMDADAIEIIKKTTNAVDNYSLWIENNVDELIKNYTGDLKDYCIKWNKAPFFGLSVYKIQNKDYKEHKIKYILKRCFRLNEAKLIVNKFKQK